ncbi:MAG: hypothetical protein JW751_15385 [Polyangiaceae bacterium]|nr:hypothetical protein [Polyangiaceae bacterium]
MSPLRTIEDFVEILRALDDAGFAYTVIGGCAVGAYARRCGLTVVSADLDLYVPAAALQELLAWLEASGAKVMERPQARSVPVAVVEWRGEELNLLTASQGLPAPERVLDAARVFELADRGVAIHLADPFDLLANKLSVRRPKDEAHIEALQQFVEQEIASEFGGPGSGRSRLAGARRLLEVLGGATLPEALTDRLLPLANDAATRRFLVAHAPLPAQVHRVVATTVGGPEHDLLQRIAKARGIDSCD